MDMKETLSFYRRRNGLSQLDLAEALEVSRQTVSKWETGAALPSAENLLALSRLYGVTADDLLNGVEAVPLLDVCPPAPPPEPDPSLIPRKKLIARMLTAVLLADLILFFMDISWYASAGSSGFLTFSQLLRVLAACAIGLCLAWHDRRWPAKRRASLLIAAAALLLGLYVLLMPAPLLWRLYDLVAWTGGRGFEDVFPSNPLRAFFAWTLFEEYAFFSHMCLIAAFQLGRLRFSRNKRNRAPRPQAAQRA